MIVIPLTKTRVSRKFCVLLLVAILVMSLHLSVLILFTAKETNTSNDTFLKTLLPKHDFEIIVLTMSRAVSLQRLLWSLEKAKYGSDVIKLSIKIDHSVHNTEVIKCARNFSFSHGPVKVTVATSNLGLRDSWLSAVSPHERGRVIILEDDVEVSPEWYKWLNGAWDAYQHRPDIAGITLYRQTLIPRNPSHIYEIVNEHEPFLFAQLGSIGFSPHPQQWAGFVKWTTHSVNINRHNFSIPNHIFTYWWSEGKRRTMWTQLFIYYTILRDLYTLHINLPLNKTLASDLREKGVHFHSTFGRDFALADASDVDLKFPRSLRKYGFDGRLMNENATAFSSLFRR